MSVRPQTKIRGMNEKWQKARKEAIRQAIARTELELKHYQHLLKNDNHTWKDCELRKPR